MTRDRLASVGQVAFVHDWLTGMRGGERVLENLCELFPRARIHTLVYVKGSVSPIIEQRRPQNAVVGYLPFAGRHWRRYLPTFPFAIEQVDVDDCDLVISSSHCAAKAVVRPGRARHLCYCHSPMRYAWDQFDVYFGPARVGVLGSAVYRPVLAAIARWDAATAGRVDRFLANSRHVAARIRRYYNREATVVYPPVDTDYFRPSGSSQKSYFLIVSALVPYKRLDIAIRAADAAGVPLKVVGTGPELARLRRFAGPRTEFLGWVSAEGLRSLYQQARAFLQPGEEDFGIAPVEAQACGCPVIALARGGALESIDDGVTGVLVSEPTVGALLEGFRRLEQQGLQAATVRARALRFSRDRFATGFSRAVDELMSSDHPW